MTNIDFDNRLYNGGIQTDDGKLDEAEEAAEDAERSAENKLFDALQAVMMDMSEAELTALKADASYVSDSIYEILQDAI